jgi:hypothetical protein
MTTDTDPTEKVERLKKDIDAIRGNLGGLIGELDRRRHDAFNLRLQLQRHALPVIIAGTALLAVVGLAIAVGVKRRQEQRALPAKVRRLRRALARMVANPDRVAKGDPHLGLKILRAGGTAAAGVAGKKLARRLVR